MPPGETAFDLAASLPVCEDDGEDSDLISLCDIVITGIEHHEFKHFWVRKYDYKASGAEGDEWAIIQALPSAEQDPPDKHVALNQTTMRKAVELYIKARLDGGMTLEDVRQLVDGSYTDVVVADDILQFALYGEQLFS